MSKKFDFSAKLDFNDIDLTAPNVVVEEIASQIANSGDIVTLSPACASFDKYPNFEKRGEHFKGIVNRL